jgi:hypothetical protein
MWPAQDSARSARRRWTRDDWRAEPNPGAGGAAVIRSKHGSATALPCLRRPLAGRRVQLSCGHGRRGTGVASPPGAGAAPWRGGTFAAPPATALQIPFSGQGSIMEKPDWVRRLNYLGDAIGGAHRLISLDMKELMAVAREATGLADFGDDDWEIGYSQSLSFFEKQVTLHTIGRLMVRSDILRTLCTRLLITEAGKKTPEIFQRKISRPVFITGRPRTGTSIMFQLLALDKNFRAPLAWEANCPVDAWPERVKSRISRAEIAQATNDLLMDIQPEIRAIHELRWDLPVECFQIMEGNFRHASGNFGDRINAIERYRWHKKVLQLLQHSNQAERWLLKCPSHLHKLEALLSVYPDARVICMHRDPAKSIPSLLSFYKYYMAALTDSERAMDFETFFASAADTIKKTVQVMASAGVKNRIFDVMFLDFMQDPLHAIRSLYEKMELEIDREFEAKVVDYLANRPRYQYGKQAYSAAEFGLTDEKIREHFGFYMDYYNIPLEN